MALFGEKYGDQVRVVSVGDWARELCGGTHAERSGQLGVIKLLGESSIGSGVRRVEALVGADAYRFLAREHVLVAQLTEALKARPEELPERVNDIVERLRAAEKELEQARDRRSCSSAGRASSRPTRPDVNGVAAVSLRIDGADAGDVRTLALDVRGRLSQEPPGCRGADRRQGRQGRRRGRDQRRRPGPRASRPTTCSAAVMPLVGGRGGGKDDVAQGGGTDASRIDEALAAARHAVAAAPPGPEADDAATAYASGSTPATPGSGSRSSDPSGFLATPVETVRARQGRPRPDRRGWSREEEAVEVVVGLPRSLSGRRGTGRGEGPGVRGATGRARRAGRRCGCRTSV